MLLTHIPPPAAAQLRLWQDLLHFRLRLWALTLLSEISVCVWSMWKKRDSKCLLSGQRHMNQLGGNGATCLTQFCSSDNLLPWRVGLKSSTFSFLEGKQWDAWCHNKEQHVKTKIRVDKMTPSLMRHPFPFSHLILFSEECYIKHATNNNPWCFKRIFPWQLETGKPIVFYLLTSINCNQVIHLHGHPCPRTY